MIYPIGCYKNKQGEISPSFSFEMMEIQGQETVSDCKKPFRTFYIAVTHFGVWLLICIYAIKIKQK